MVEFRSLFSWQPLPFVFLLTLLCIIVNILIIRKCQFRRLQELSGGGLPTYPFIGCLISFYKNQHRLLDWYTELLAKSTTSTIIVQRLGANRTIVTANPENVEYILKTNFSNFPKGRPFTEILGDFLGNGIFNVDGELWRSQRKFASHEFSAKSLKQFVLSTLEEEVKDKLLPLLESLSEQSKVVDLQQLLKRLSFNVICKVTLGLDRCSLDPSVSTSPLTNAFEIASQISAKRGAAPLFFIWKIKRWLGVGSERRLRQAVKEVHSHLMEIIHERKMKIYERGASGDGPRSDDLLSRLLLAGHEEEVIRDMLISFVLAGRDTTSAAMTWLFWLLSNDPEMEQQVVKESELKLAETLFDYESLKDLVLLKSCLFESMRLFPPVAWDSKHALVDDVLPDGTPIKAGDRVTYFPYGMGRMEAIWGSDRLKFKPDRWFVDGDRERGDMEKVCSYKFPVFQAGPRMCLGKDMAFIQMMYVVASILDRFRIKPIRSDKPIFVPLLTAHMAGGLEVLVYKRK